MASLGDILARVVDEQGWQKPLQLQMAVALWDGIVGPSVALNCRAVEVQGDTLVVKAKNAAWRSEISFRKADIMVELNKRIHPFQIKDIRFLA